MGLKECLIELEKIFKSGSTDEDKTGKFVCGVEYALKIISDHRESALPEEWKSCLDDLLCQAFTIAKIALNNDLNEITAVAQKVGSLRCFYLSKNKIVAINNILYNL